MSMNGTKEKIKVPSGKKEIKKAAPIKGPDGPKKETMAQRQERERTQRVPQGGLELINEKQETIFNSELSSAADDHLKACNEADAWKERRRHTERALIEAMKTAGHVSLRVGTQKVIKYKHIDAKDVLTLKDYKPAAPRGRRRKF